MPAQQAFRIILHPKAKFYQMVLKPCLARNVSLEITHETFYLDWSLFTKMIRVPHIMWPFVYMEPQGFYSFWVYRAPKCRSDFAWWPKAKGILNGSILLHLLSIYVQTTY